MRRGSGEPGNGLLAFWRSSFPAPKLMPVLKRTLAYADNGAKLDPLADFPAAGSLVRRRSGSDGRAKPLAV